MTTQFTVQCGFAAYHANTVSVEAERIEGWKGGGHAQA